MAGCCCFASDRGGTTGLWAGGDRDGKTIGPELLRPDFASSWSLGVTSAGAMYVWKDRRGLSVRTAGLDLTAGSYCLTTRTRQSNSSAHEGVQCGPNDGKHLAYQSCNGLGGGPCTVLTWSLDSGKVTELPTPVKYQQGFSWSPTAGSDHGR
jgi:hypothetical protein